MRRGRRPSRPSRSAYLTPPRAGTVRLKAPTTTATSQPDSRTLSRLIAGLGTDLEAACEELPVAFYVIDRDGVICWLNRAFHADGAAVGVFGAARLVPEERSCPLAGDAPPLTPRQHEVLHLLTEGLTTAEVAARLNVAEETARNHIRALLRSLQVHTRLHAVVEALRNGWI